MAGTVHVEPAGVDLVVDDCETVMHAAERLGYRWPTVCHGQAVCTTCFFEVLEGSEHLVAAAPLERHALDNSPVVELAAGGEVRREVRREVRLACQATVTGDVVVRKRGVRPAS